MTNVRKGARDETSFLKPIAFPFVCSNQFTTTVSKYLGINLKEHVCGKDMINYLQKESKGYE